jgi:SpoIIAA-like
VVIELLPSMPAGTIGLRVAGRVTRDDFHVLEPLLEEATRAGDVRIVEVIGPDYEGLEPSAALEDLKVGLRFVVGHHGAIKRVAIVTDTEWIIRTIHLVGWMTPGGLRLFPLAELEDAKVWAAA